MLSDASETPPVSTRCDFNRNEQLMSWWLFSTVDTHCIITLVELVSSYDSKGICMALTRNELQCVDCNVGTCHIKM